MQNYSLFLAEADISVEERKYSPVALFLLDQVISGG